MLDAAMDEDDADASPLAAADGEKRCAGSTAKGEAGCRAGSASNGEEARCLAKSIPTRPQLPPHARPQLDRLARRLHHTTRL